MNTSNKIVDLLSIDNKVIVEEIISNLVATPVAYRGFCQFCGVEFTQDVKENNDDKKAAENFMHGRGCIWATALTLYGYKVCQK